MEPFGLLNLLKTLIPNEETPPPSQPPESEPLPPPQPIEQEEKPNACLGFLEAHEKRAQRKR